MFHVKRIIVLASIKFVSAFFDFPPP